MWSAPQLHVHISSQMKNKNTNEVVDTFTQCIFDDLLAIKFA